MSHPAFGTAPIRCGRTRCSWRGYETELSESIGSRGSAISSCSVCPTCGYDSTTFMTEGEIKVWKREKHAQAANGGDKQ